MANTPVTNPEIINTDPGSIQADIAQTETVPENIPAEKPNQSLSPLKLLIIVLLIFLVGGGILAAVYKFSFKPQSISLSSDDDIEVRTINFAPTSKQAVPYKPVKTAYQARIPSYTIVPQELENLTAFLASDDAVDFSENNLALLTSKHSFVVPTNLNFKDDADSPVYRDDDWVAKYNDYKGSGEPCWRELDDSILITTDFMSHLYHRLLERQMEYLDKEEFAPRLKTLTTNLLTDLKTTQKTAPQENQASLDRVAAYLLVADALLTGVPEFETPSRASFEENDTLEQALARLQIAGNDFSPEVKSMAQAELERIFAANGGQESVIYAGLATPAKITDYTQFTPRSYYNKNATLRSYFRAMMWYGRTGFELNNAQLTRDALNITVLMTNNQQTRELWEAIYKPTSFLVGTSDDLSFIDYEPFTQGKIGLETITSLQKNALNFKKPQVFSDLVVDANMSEMTEEELLLGSLGWRMMGQRTVADAVIFDQLTQGETLPDPVTGEVLPSGATAAMVMSALGDQTAQEHLQAWTQTNFSDSQRVLNNRLADLQKQFADLPEEVWTQNSYWGWLYLYKTLFNSDKDLTGYPLFMTFANWRQKDLNSAIGSWTELKHDTLLYAKQSYAEMGAGGPDDCEVQPVPKGYVEPNIEFYDRLESLAIFVNDNLDHYGLLHEEMSYRTERFLEVLRLYRSLAVKQLANEQISDEEFEQLQTSPWLLEGIAAVWGNEQQTEKEARSALIADVQTDGKLKQITYEATGIPQTIYAAVKDINGTRIVKGLIFSQYEFTTPLEGQRLNDEEWWKQVYTHDTAVQPPPMSPWSQSI